jgi:hypothetical protein
MPADSSAEYSHAETNARSTRGITPGPGRSGNPFGSQVLGGAGFRRQNAVWVWLFTQRRRDVCVCEIGALEQQRLAPGLREGIGETIS